ncbi:unnamed protein product [Scytosiphon promiscuus]
MENKCEKGLTRCFRDEVKSLLQPHLRRCTLLQRMNWAQSGQRYSATSRALLAKVTSRATCSSELCTFKLQ